jgi:hypothetical protein
MLPVDGARDANIKVTVIKKSTKLKETVIADKKCL